MGKRRAATTARKAPRQERSRATVECIMQAAAYILVKSGWQGFTTNAVAERAGVNIASLYQYFPNKEALVAELQRRHVAEARAGVVEALPPMRTHRSLRETLTAVVQAGVAEHRLAPALHRVFAEELPRSARLEDPNEGEAQRHLLAITRPLLKNVPDEELAVFIAGTAVHAVIHEAAGRRPELLERSELVTELVALLEGYLRRRSPRGA
jgi:AcrR family transcriptional regulator